MINLGNVVGIIKAQAAPTKTNVLWAHQYDGGDLTKVYIKYYDFETSSWKKLIEGVVAIGSPESGNDYLNGLWEDLVQATLVGVFVDRANQQFKIVDDTINQLVPPNPPELSDAELDTIGVSGKLSFDSSNPIVGYTDAETIPSGGGAAVAVDESFSVSGKRKGLIAASGDDVDAVLNDQVVAHSYSYPANSFPDGDKGALKLEVNGVVVSNLDLTTLTAQDDTTAGTTTGLNITAAVSVQFENGSDFTNRKYRTGAFKVLRSDLRNGYNYIRVLHEIAVGNTKTTGYFEYIVDDNNNAISFSSETLDSFVGSGSKFVSGIEYHTDGVAAYDVTVSNGYKNTFNEDSDAVSHGASTKCDGADAALADSVGVESKQVVITDKVITISDGRLNPSSGGAITAKTTVKHTTKSTQTSAGDSVNDIIAEKGSFTADTLLVGNFNDENYRIPTTIDTSAHANVTTALWASANSLVDGGAGYQDGLHQMNGELQYPTVNFNALGTAATNPNNGDGGTKDYSTLTGDKKWLRFFQQVSPTTANFRIQIDGDVGISFVPLETSLDAQKAWLEIKAPGESNWMDGYKAFTTGEYDEGDGCQNASNGSGGINAWLGLTIGIKSTANSNGKILVRITVSDEFTSKITTATFEYL